MKNRIRLFFFRVIADDRGQSLPWVAAIVSAFLAVGGGLGVDLGRAYVVRAQLQNYANAMALAAAGEVYNTSLLNNATTWATTYSASKGDYNYTSGLGTVTPSVSQVCLNVLMPTGSTCSTGSPANAVKVSETTSIPTFFMKLFGVPNLTITANATASMQGKAQPWNVAIILDATGSMSTTDANCGSITEFKCATNGIEALLASTDPCPPGTTSCTNSTANFHVALFGFPNVSTSTVSDENGCTGSYGNTPQFMEYTLPPTSLTSYSPITYQSTSGGGGGGGGWGGGGGGGSSSWTATYEVTYGASDADANGFVSDYYQPSGTNGLNSSSSIVKAVGGCMQPISQGASAPQLQGVSNGGITYYASVIYSAQAALAAEKTLHPDANNAIIFLSDGQANLVSVGDFPTNYTSTTGLYSLNSNGTYPSMKDECQQAIVASQAAMTAGTTVYGVAYGSEQSGCTSGSGATDTTLVATGKNQAFTLSSLTPCVTIENIASSLNDFYSDYNQSGSGVDTSCVDNSHTVSSLQAIFLSIGASFTEPRLLPNGAK
ncbi:MAG: TadG family pilus assembly protein [Terracidiphilus sp.]